MASFNFLRWKITIAYAPLYRCTVRVKYYSLIRVLYIQMFRVEIYAKKHIGRK